MTNDLLFIFPHIGKLSCSRLTHTDSVSISSSLYLICSSDTF